MCVSYCICYTAEAVVLSTRTEQWCLCWWLSMLYISRFSRLSCTSYARGSRPPGDLCSTSSLVRLSILHTHSMMHMITFNIYVVYHMVKPFYHLPLWPQLLRKRDDPNLKRLQFDCTVNILRRLHCLTLNDLFIPV